MFSKFVPCCLALALGVTSLYASDTQPSSTLKVDQPTAIPGSVLQPGTYTIRVVDHLSDRVVLSVDGGGATRPTFLGISNAAFSSTKGEIKWAKSPDSNTYLKGWNFGISPGALEFVYPKDDAVALAKANGSQVAAIDPASEGRVSNNGLSKEDMQMVTLWLLSPTHVGPGEAAGIKAEKYQQVASIAHKPVVARLPRTASSLPLLTLAGLLSLLVAAGFRVAALVRD